MFVRKIKQEKFYSENLHDLMVSRQNQQHEKGKNNTYTTA